MVSQFFKISLTMICENLKLTSYFLKHMSQKERDNIIALIKRSDASNLFFAIAKAILNVPRTKTIIPAHNLILVQGSWNTFEQYLLSNRNILKEILETIGNFSIADSIRYNNGGALFSLESELFLSEFIQTPLYYSWLLEPVNKTRQEEHPPALSLFNPNSKGISNSTHIDNRW